MTQPQITPAGEDQPMSEGDRPPCRGEVAARAQEIAEIGGRPAEAHESPGRCAGDFIRLEGQVRELARLLADLGQDQEGQLDENERLDRQLGALGRDVKTQRRAVVELENRLDDLATLARELAERQTAGTRGERAIWWPDLPAGQERTAALRLLRAWADDVLRGHHPELVNDSLQACWDRHDDVLDELTALQAAWHAAYRGKAAPATAAIESRCLAPAARTRSPSLRTAAPVHADARRAPRAVSPSLLAPAYRGRRFRCGGRSPGPGGRAG